jgi:hypothetical protein
MNKHSVRWTTWTYKDVGVKVHLHAEGWGWLPPSPVDGLMEQVGELASKSIGDDTLAAAGNNWHMQKAFLCTYVAGLLQTPYARAFKGMSESTIDKVLASREVSNCWKNKGQLTVLKQRLTN